MHQLNETDVYFCKLQGAIARTNHLRKLRLLTWKETLRLFSLWLSKEELFRLDTDLIERVNRFYNSEVDSKNFSNYISYLTNRKLFHCFDLDFLIQSCDDFSLLGMFLEDLDNYDLEKCA